MAKIWTLGNWDLIRSINCYGLTSVEWNQIASFACPKSSLEDLGTRYTPGLTSAELLRNIRIILILITSLEKLVFGNTVFCILVRLGAAALVSAAVPKAVWTMVDTPLLPAAVAAISSKGLFFRDHRPLKLPL